MKNKHLIATAVLLVTAQFAFAQQSPANGSHGELVSTKTRAEVMAELAQSKADGSYEELHREYIDQGAHFVSTKTREQVLAELRQAQEDGSYAAMHQEYLDPGYHFTSEKTRAEVYDELVKAQADGSLEATRNLYYQY